MRLGSPEVDLSVDDERVDDCLHRSVEPRLTEHEQKFVYTVCGKRPRVHALQNVDFALGQQFEIYRKHRRRIFSN